MRKKELEIQLEQNVAGFRIPKIELEQYQTPALVASNLLYWAYMNGDIENKSILDLCSGTGILAIGAALLGGEVTAIEIDKDCQETAEENQLKTKTPYNLLIGDVLDYKFDGVFDTALANPPFGIQQKKYKDLDFVLKAVEVANVCYVILDGSPDNQAQIPSILKERGLALIDSYIDTFVLSSTYPWHKMKRKLHQVLMLKVTRI